MSKIYELIEKLEALSTLESKTLSEALKEKYTVSKNYWGKVAG